MSNDRFEIEPEQPHHEKSGFSGCLKGCLIAGAIVIFLVVVALFWLSRNWRDIVADFGSEVVDQVINESDLPDQERVEVKEQVTRVTDAFRAGDISADQLGMVMQQIIESPLMTSIVVAGIEKKYIEDSGLTDEEKEAGRVALRRFVRGMVNGKISEEDFDEAMSKIADRQPDGQWQMRDSASDEELRELIQFVKEKSDAAEIPEEVEEVDPSDEMRRIIDDAMDDAPARNEMEAADQ